MVSTDTEAADSVSAVIEAVGLLVSAGTEAVDVVECFSWYRGY